MKEARGGVGEETVLVTLVRTSGSTYRRAGARMLVMPGCQTVGTISGGCLEPQVAREAWEATRPGERAVLEVDNSSEEETWGPASGCHGKLLLLAERSGAGGRHGVLEEIARVREGEAVGVWAQFFRRRGAGWEPAALSEQDRAAWREEIETTQGNETSRWVERGEVGAFLECLCPPVHLVIAGAGNDAQPVARIAQEAGWMVSVVDTRARLATAERFVGAREVRVGGAEALGQVLRKRSVAVLMSHRFVDDAAALAEILPRRLAYVGLLGPRRRTERLLAYVSEQGTAIDAAWLSSVRSPVGLDIGADSPETIALAIVVEIQAALAGRIATPLHQRVGAIDVPGDVRMGAR
jgi:xanthine/CO dehydrogenase XdhC/CoxF family maturation factor